MSSSYSEISVSSIRLAPELGTIITMWPWLTHFRPGWRSSTRRWPSRGTSPRIPTHRTTAMDGGGGAAWYQHQNMRDERAEAFTSLLWEGVYHYSYVARATTPGRFVVPPAKAEEMYSPEVFGRSGSDWVIVE